MCDYETIRLRNLEDNRRVLASFGLSDPFKSLPKIIKKDKNSAYRPPKIKSVPSVTDSSFVGGSVYSTRRQSARLREFVGSEVSYEEIDEDGEKKHVPKVPASRPKTYGQITDMEVGTSWATRLECCRDGIHRPTVAGIHAGANGAYSIALSGGYEDDVDMGDCFTYTGEGGRDLKGTKSNPKNLRTAQQSKDQTLTKGNLALSRNVETKNPVRVIRGYKLKSPFAPEDGYRYDGLYTVEKCWFTTGLSGFGVWKFALRRCSDQGPLPWQFYSDSNSSTKPVTSDVPDSCQNRTVTVNNSDNFMENDVTNDEKFVVVGGKADEDLQSLCVEFSGANGILQEIAADCPIEPAPKRSRRNKRLDVTKAKSDRGSS